MEPSMDSPKVVVSILTSGEKDSKSPANDSHHPPQPAYEIRGISKAQIQSVRRYVVGLFLHQIAEQVTHFVFFQVLQQTIWHE